jgi:hypothetical protein
MRVPIGLPWRHLTRPNGRQNNVPKPEKPTNGPDWLGSTSRRACRGAEEERGLMPLRVAYVPALRRCLVEASSLLHARMVTAHLFFCLALAPFNRDQAIEDKSSGHATPPGALVC